MHEMGITAEIIESAVAAAEREGACRIDEIRISVGELTEVQDFALQFAFETLRQDTMAAGAALVVTYVPPKSRCMECGEEFTHDKWDFTCPKCGSLVTENLEGRELRIDSIDIETGDECEETA